MILDLSYLRYPLPSDITMLFESGRFEEMERLIELNLSKPELPAALKKHLEFLRYCAEDIREAYQLTSEQAFDNARKRIPDLTRDEFHHLRDDRETVLPQQLHQQSSANPPPLCPPGKRHLHFAGGGKRGR